MNLGFGSDTTVFCSAHWNCYLCRGLTAKRKKDLRARKAKDGTHSAIYHFRAQSRHGPSIAALCPTEPGDDIRLPLSTCRHHPMIISLCSELPVHALLRSDPGAGKGTGGTPASHASLSLSLLTHKMEVDETVPLRGLP